MALLTRLTWQRDPEVWTVHCRDGRGRRTTLQIGLTTTGIAITAMGSGPWQFTLLESGRLRGAVREALLTLVQGAGTEPISPGRRTAPRKILIRERPGGRGPRSELAPPTGQPHPHQQPDPPVAQVAIGSAPDRQENRTYGTLVPYGRGGTSWL